MAWLKKFISGLTAFATSRVRTNVRWNVTNKVEPETGVTRKYGL